MSKKSSPDLEPESPIPFRAGSNGELVPPAPTAADRQAEALFRRVVDERARRQGVSRRSFVESAAGTAAALWVINAVYACGGDESAASSGSYEVDGGATEDSGIACEKLSGDEFIFDVQTHHINPTGAWRQKSPLYEAFFESLPQAACGEADEVFCFDTDHYLREMFVNSETAVAVLSAVPALPGSNPLEAEEQRATLELIQKLSGSQRLVTHGLVLPDLGPAQLDGMQALAEQMKISAWKVYTPFGGWRLDDPAIGIPFIERARELGIKLICAHKGLPLPGFDANYASPEDIGVVAAAYPDVKFLVYHSGFELDVAEGPYDPNSPVGVDRLIKTVLDNGIGPSGNVYAELGSTWRHLMTKPVEAAHTIGKLLKHLGEDRILWGTDSIWYGSPQDQIAAFRAFQIPEALQESHGYPALTPAARAKIFGLNAAAAYGIDPDAVRCAIAEDDIGKSKSAYLERKVPTFRGYGPQTRGEFFAFLRARGGMPG
jgi:predicted TIM-barrel fold metal-dependent hydrolase